MYNTSPIPFFERPDQRYNFNEKRNWEGTEFKIYADHRRFLPFQINNIGDESNLSVLIRCQKTDETHDITSQISQYFQFADVQSEGATIKVLYFKSINSILDSFRGFISFEITIGSTPKTFYSEWFFCTDNLTDKIKITWRNYENLKTTYDEHKVFYGDNFKNFIYLDALSDFEEWPVEETVTERNLLEFRENTAWGKNYTFEAYIISPVVDLLALIRAADEVSISTELEDFCNVTYFNFEDPGETASLFLKRVSVVYRVREFFSTPQGIKPAQTGGAFNNSFNNSFDID